jgi:hypothetical protein
VTENLARVPLRITTEWRSKIVTSDLPRYIPHTEWSLELVLASRVPLRVAIFLSVGQYTEWGLLSDAASQEMELGVSFFPSDWRRSDDVQVNFAGRRAQVTDSALKSDPRDVVKVTAPETAETGEVFDVAELPADAISLMAVEVANVDTESRRHHRWRIKPRLAASLPEPLVPLTSGRQSRSFKD